MLRIKHPSNTPGHGTAVSLQGDALDSAATPARLGKRAGLKPAPTKLRDLHVIRRGAMNGSRFETHHFTGGHGSAMSLHETCRDAILGVRRVFFPSDGIRRLNKSVRSDHPVLTSPPNPLSTLERGSKAAKYRANPTSLVKTNTLLLTSGFSPLQQSDERQSHKSTEPNPRP